MKNMKQLCSGLSVGLLLFANIACASFNKDLWPKWQVNNPRSQQVISHQEWQAFLDKRVVINDECIALVDYPHLTTADIERLNSYITSMSHVHISDYNRKEQLAFWLNLYNALTVQTIARYYPVSGVQEVNISPGLFSVGPWGANLITLDGTDLSLDQIHNRIIRPIWNDSRTHYAINNGTIGAANLGKEAFQGDRLEKQLNKVTANYINSMRGTQFIEGKLIVSKIYEWFLDDFGGKEEDVLIHLSQFAREPLRSQLKHINTIDGYTYNWRLNSTNGSR